MGNNWMLMNSELRRKRKEIILFCNIIEWYLLGGTEENHETLIQNNWSSNRDSNWELGIVTTS
jgi:hypothetical protein